MMAALKNEQTFSFGPWTVAAQKCPILNTKERETVEQKIELPLPEMVFANNLLQIGHEAGFGVRFVAMDALKMVNNREDTLKVADAELWKRTRESSEGINNVIKPFDWTYTNQYVGSLYHLPDAQPISVLQTDERIDIEKLKEPEKIHFYEDVCLFEDELADNGIALLNVKLRVMASGFFVLLRFFLRVDGVLARIYDTRIYHQVGTNYMLREITRREGPVTERFPHDALIDPEKMCSYLMIKEKLTERLQFPAASDMKGTELLES
ncbi:TIP41-like protein [Oscarella lobularis]|uniref:TIP41-like protein n=1 Tax=Oscarella lobularis TaxID=121494 RepID=UPI003313646C